MSTSQGSAVQAAEQRTDCADRLDDGRISPRYFVGLWDDKVGHTCPGEELDESVRRNGNDRKCLAPGFVNGSVIEINGGYCFK